MPLRQPETSLGLYCDRGASHPRLPRSYQQEKQRDAEKAAKQAAEERTERACQLVAETKQQTLREFIEAGFSPESFEADWPVIRARLSAEKIAERRDRAAGPRVMCTTSCQVPAMRTSPRPHRVSQPSCSAL
jgi:hypothetical protein